MEIRPIAQIRSDFAEKFGIPRQSGLVESLEARVVFAPEFRNPDALRGIEGFSHLWLIWHFDRIEDGKFSPTVAPPKLGGKTRVGVFATRSPFRPNPIGLSALKLDSIEYHKTYGPVLHVSGVDMLDGTPVYDIKPYLPYADSYPDATDGFAGRVRGNRIAVSIPEEMLIKIEEKERDTIKQLLSQDPRTAYLQDAERIWGLSYQQYNIRFRVENETAYVLDVEIKQGADRLYRKREADRGKVTEQKDEDRSDGTTDKAGEK